MTRVESLLVATRNTGKVSEFRSLLGSMKLIVEDLSGVPDAPDVEEIGTSFLENASIKATAYAIHAGSWALADDSGLCVDALDGKPGIYSARWAAMHDAGQGDAANNRLLIEQLKDVPDEQRTGRFMCALALADPEGRVVLTCQASVEGRLLREPRGTNGFGYDPLFLVEELGRTTAELSSDEKHEISHRGRAMRRMIEMMHEHGLIG